MRKPADFYDVNYFGFTADHSKSNYGQLGGYTDELANSSVLVNWIIDEHLQGIKLLELGCAHGAAVRMYRQRGIHAYGLDCSEYILSVAAADVTPYLYIGDMHITAARN